MLRPRISIATVMMLVVTAASASALAARMLRLLAKSAQVAGDRYDGVAVVILAIVLTGLALAARKGHSLNQAMVQITLACLGLLFVLSLPEWGSFRLMIYWLQILFATLVVGPLMVRRAVRTRMDRGPRRTWWMRTCEAIAFAYLNILLVLAGAGIEFSVAVLMVSLI